MEQSHNTLSSQQSQKKKGILTVLLMVLALGAFVGVNASGTGSHHETPAHEDSHHEQAHDDADHAEEHHDAEHADHEHADDADKDHGDHEHEAHGAEEHADHAEHEAHSVSVPAWYSVLPFVVLLLCIAVLPLFHKTEHWWEKNSNRFLVASVLGLITLGYYAFVFGDGVHDHLSHGHSDPGIPAAVTVLKNAIMGEYIPFITLLFSLYVITGGIAIETRIAGRAHVNTCIIGLGAMLASFVGTTGAAMLLIRPLLAANAKREYVAHTVVFFIFAVCNTGGCLLPIGDPPLFLGFLRGVDFFWTLRLWPEWLFTNATIMIVYLLYDMKLSKKEKPEAFEVAESSGSLISMFGKLNLVWLLGIVGCVATLDPSKPFPGTTWHAPLYFREMLMLLITLASLVTTTAGIRLKNSFNYDAIVEVAALFSGIFICMQAPVQILNVYGKTLGFDSPAKFFWGTGTLSSFLDNAPTYVVFFETAKTMEPVGQTIAGVSEVFLVAISLGAVFMGAMTYIGNGPNFMVKAIAEKNNIRMPSFFGYMIYSVLVLVPIFLATTFLFLKS
ncbi:MAG: sodium:proton antiporter [Planctomycetaceae bacterium]|nr:sodium:proton antiporter [Planctomycetaceae bacterium]